MVDNNGHPRLLDFGIALEGGNDDDSDDHALTPGFASPEQLAGHAIATTSDIYQLGLVLRAVLLKDNPPAPSAPITNVGLGQPQATLRIDPNEPPPSASAPARNTVEPDVRRVRAGGADWVAMPGPARKDLAQLIPAPRHLIRRLAMPRPPRCAKTSPACWRGARWRRTASLRGCAWRDSSSAIESLWQ